MIDEDESPEIRVWLNVRADRGTYTARWKCPITGDKKHKTIHARNRKEATKKVGVIEDQLARNGGVLPDGSSKSRPTWEQFVQRFRSEELPQLEKTSRYKFNAAVKAVEVEFASRQITKPMLAHATSELLSSVRAKMLSGPKSSATTKSELATLMSAFTWAEEAGLMQPVKLPRLKGKRVEEDPEMKGRPLSDEEFFKLREAMGATKSTKKIAKYADEWRHLLDGLWLSGHRLGEAFDLHATCKSHHRTLSITDNPRIKFRPTQKNRKTQVVAITPDFAEFLRNTTLVDGYFFNPRGIRGRYKTSTSVARVIADLGRDVGISTGEEQWASAHDLRRTFARRWSTRIMPPVLQHLMRHSSIETTMKFYVGNDADVAAAAIYQVWLERGEEWSTIECDQACDQLAMAS